MASKYSSHLNKILKLIIVLLILYSLYVMINYIEMRSSFLRSYNWNLAHSFGLAKNILTTINNKEDVSPEYIYDLHLAVNIVLEETKIDNSRSRINLPIKAGELEDYSACLRVITFKSLKGILDKEDIDLLRIICIDFTTLGALHSNDNQLSYREYNEIRPTLQLFSGKIDVYNYLENNEYILKNRTKDNSSGQ